MTSCVSSRRSTNISPCEHKTSGSAQRGCWTPCWTRGSESQPMSDDLRAVVDAWDSLPEHVRQTVRTIVESASTTKGERARGRKGS